MTGGEPPRLCLLRTSWRAPPSLRIEVWISGKNGHSKSISLFSHLYGKSPFVMDGVILRLYY